VIRDLAAVGQVDEHRASGLRAVIDADGVFWVMESLHSIG